MDDYSVTSLTESKNEWCARLVNVMTPAVIKVCVTDFQMAIEPPLDTSPTAIGQLTKFNDGII